MSNKHKTSYHEVLRSLRTGIKNVVVRIPFTVKGAAFILAIGAAGITICSGECKAADEHLVGNERTLSTWVHSASTEWSVCNG